MGKSIDGVPTPPLAPMVERVLSRSGMGDTKNNFFGHHIVLQNPKKWDALPLVESYEQYIKDKYKHIPGLVEAVLAASDVSFVQKYNEFAAKANALIHKDVASEEEARAVAVILGDAMDFIEEYCRSLPG